MFALNPELYAGLKNESALFVDSLVLLKSTLYIVPVGNTCW